MRRVKLDLYECENCGHEFHALSILTESVTLNCPHCDESLIIEDVRPYNTSQLDKVLKNWTRSVTKWAESVHNNDISIGIYKPNQVTNKDAHRMLISGFKDDGFDVVRLVYVGTKSTKDIRQHIQSLNKMLAPLKLLCVTAQPHHSYLVILYNLSDDQ